MKPDEDLNEVMKTELINMLRGCIKYNCGACSMNDLAKESCFRVLMEMAIDILERDRMKIDAAKKRIRQAMDRANEIDSKLDNLLEKINSTKGEVNESYSYLGRYCAEDGRKVRDMSRQY